MSGMIILGFLIIHVVFWFIQIWVNQQNGGAGCVDFSNFTCGAPVLEAMAKAPQEFADVNGLIDLTISLGSFLAGVLLGFVQLAFINYDWVYGGGQITDLIAA